MRVILVVLALIWVLALTPTLLRKLAERESTYSVTRFHRSLRVMRQSYPAQAAAAGASGRLTPPVSGAAVRSGTRPASGRAAAQSARRRRQVLMVLGGGLAFTFLLGLVPGLSVLWDGSLLLLATTAAYVGLLIHFRRAEMERAQKVVHIARPTPADEDTAEVPIVPAAAAWATPAVRVSRVRAGGPVRILDRREARTPAVIGG